LPLIETHWDDLLRVAASIKDGWCSATQALERFGSDARGDPLYHAAVALGRLVRTQFLCDYFTKRAFREALRRALNHGEAVHALQRRIRVGTITAKRDRSRDEQAAISGSLSLLANLVMVWNNPKAAKHCRRPGPS
jgi:TnpA family transposase